MSETRMVPFQFMICLFLLSFLGISCTHIRDKKQIEKAERYIKTDPASALRILDSVQYIPGLSAYDRNNYRFLKTGALYRLKKEMGGLENALKTARFFEKRGMTEKSGWAYLYAGKIAQTEGNYPEASVYLSEAKEKGEMTADSSLLLNTYYYLGEVYSSSHDKRAGIEAYQTALRYYRNLPVESYLSYKIGNCFLNIQQYNEAMYYYRIAENKSRNAGDSLETARLLFNIGRSYAAVGDEAYAIAYFERASVYDTTYEHQITCNLELASVYLKKDQLASAFGSLGKISPNRLLQPELLQKYYEIRSRLYEKAGKYPLAYADLKVYFHLSDSLQDKETDQRIDRIISQHNRKKLMARNMFLTRQRTILTLGIAVLGLLIAFIVLYGIYLTRKKENKYNEACTTIEVLQNLRSETDRCQDKFRKMLSDKLEISRKLALIGGLPVDKNKSFLKMYDEIMGEYHRAQLDWTELYFTLNYLYDDFVNKLVGAYPELKEREIQECCLLRAGFRTDEIAFVMQQSIYTIHKHKTWIRKKLGIDERSDIIEGLLKKFEEKKC